MGISTDGKVFVIGLSIPVEEAAPPGPLYVGSRPANYLENKTNASFV
jgi:hypothetical protein